jgi:hypothetical protein
MNYKDWMMKSYEMILFMGYSTVPFGTLVIRRIVYKDAEKEMIFI